MHPAVSSLVQAVALLRCSNRPPPRPLFGIASSAPFSLCDRQLRTHVFEPAFAFRARRQSPSPALARSLTSLAPRAETASPRGPTLQHELAPILRMLEMIAIGLS